MSAYLSGQAGMHETWVGWENQMDPTMPLEGSDSCLSLDFITKKYKIEREILAGTRRLSYEDKISPDRSHMPWLSSTSDDPTDILWVSIFSSKVPFRRGQLKVASHNCLFAGLTDLSSDRGRVTIFLCKSATELWSGGSKICRRKYRKIRNYHVKGYFLLRNLWRERKDPLDLEIFERTIGQFSGTEEHPVPSTHIFWYAE